MTLKEGTQEFVNRYQLKVGSKVKALKRFKDFDVQYNGDTTNVRWVDSILNVLGEVGEIYAIGDEYLQISFPVPKGIFSLFPTIRFTFPYHSLQPVFEDGTEIVLLEENFTPVLVKPDGSTLVNGLSVTFEELETLYLKAGKAMQSNKSNGEVDDGSNETWKEGGSPFGS